MTTDDESRGDDTQYAAPFATAAENKAVPATRNDYVLAASHLMEAADMADLDGHSDGDRIRAVARAFAAMASSWQTTDAPVSAAGHDESERAALVDLFEAYQRLKRLGWNDIIYCPKDGALFLSVEVGSTGVHRTNYEGEWPKGTWWVHDAGDLWPARPCLWKPLESRPALDAVARTSARTVNGPRAANSSDLGASERSLGVLERD